MKVLVVVDMQKDFVDGSLGSPEAQAIVPNVKKKVEEAVKNGDLIIYTRDTHPKGYLSTREGKRLPVKHCVHETEGWRILDELLPPADYVKWVIRDKYTFGSLELPNCLLAGVDAYYGEDVFIEEIEIVGLVADICVISNALILKAAFYESATISVDSACTAGTTKENYQSALNIMRSCQIEVI